MATNPIIHLQDIEKSYQLEGLSTTVLKKVSLSISPGEMVAIVGASGSGKSTLMNILGLLDKQDLGSYWLHGKDMATFNEEALADLRNQYIGFVFQQFNLLPRFTALQNVALPLAYRGLSELLIQEKACLALEQVGMASFAAHRPTQLSGGQQQRVAIARALVTEPQVILADEPTGALDSHTGTEVMNLFLSLHRQGRTIVLITHDESIASLCERQITIADGLILSEHQS